MRVKGIPYHGNLWRYFELFVVDDDMELHIASLTAIERTKWANERRKYFSAGINKESIQTIEEAIFLVSKQLIIPLGGVYRLSCRL